MGRAYRAKPTRSASPLSLQSTPATKLTHSTHTHLPVPPHTDGRSSLLAGTHSDAAQRHCPWWVHAPYCALTAPVEADYWRYRPSSSLFLACLPCLVIHRRRGTADCHASASNHQLAERRRHALASLTFDTLQDCPCGALAQRRPEIFHCFNLVTTGSSCRCVRDISLSELSCSEIPPSF